MHPLFYNQGWLAARLLLIDQNSILDKKIPSLACAAYVQSDKTWSYMQNWPLTSFRVAVVVVVVFVVDVVVVDVVVDGCSVKTMVAVCTSMCVTLVKC